MFCVHACVLYMNINVFCDVICLTMDGNMFFIHPLIEGHLGYFPFSYYRECCRARLSMDITPKLIKELLGHRMCIISCQIMGKQWKQCHILFWGAPKSLHMVIAAMKLKDANSLKGKL